MNRIRVTFFGSSTDDYSKDIETLFECLFAVYDEVIVVSGGYQGTMKDVAEKGKAIAKKEKKKIYVQGILFDGYRNDPNQSGVNVPNNISDAQISTTSIGSRVQSMIELADIFIALPGKTGTLHEIIQTIETIQYGMDYLKEAENFKRLLIHSKWKKSIDNLHENGNMPQRVYQHLLNNLFSFDSKKDRKKEQLINKLKSIAAIEDKKKNPDSIIIPIIKIFGSKTNETLANSHKLAEVIGKINRVLYGDYFDETRSNKVVGLDIALREADIETGQLFKLDSIGTYSYFIALDKFLGKYKSVIENEEETNKWLPIKNIKVTDTSELLYHDHKNNSSLKGSEQTTIDEWVKQLERDSLGKHLYWMSVKLESYYHISAFLVLDCFLSESLRIGVENVINKFLLENMLVVSKDSYIAKTENFALKAAISQVMARNMSHNIGSHVLSKFKDKKEIENPSAINQYKANSALNPNFDDSNEQVAYFNEYLKNRMDFLADIATTDPVMETPMYLFRDILKGFDKNRILLNRISGVSTDKKFKIIVTDKSGNAINNLNHSDDPLLSIPNEILGAQAFYILLENIIRNIYKHGNPEKDIEIRIEVKEYEKDASFYELSIYDNIAKENIDEAVKSRNTAFNDSVLDKSKKALRPNNLGTIEMDVCAAYLRCLPIISIEDEEYNLQEDNNTEIPRLIYAYKHKLNDSGFSLGYKIHIAKPKEILVVANDKNSFIITDCKDEKDLSKAGIKVITKEELGESKEIFNHQILYSLVSSEELNKILEKKQSTLPKRIVYSNEHITLESAEKFIESVWEQYALRFFSKNSNGYYFHWSKIKRVITPNDNTIIISIPNGNEQCSSYENLFIDNHNKEWSAKKSLNLYYDMACSHSKINKLADKIFEDFNKKLTAEYIEVINTKVIVLDERIQQNISNENRKYTANNIGTQLAEYFEKQKLFIPKKEDCNLNEVSFGTLSESDCENGKTVSSAICRYIKGQLSGTEKPDFVILHLGILEKMLPSGKDKKLNDIDDLIKQLFNSERKRLVVTSGRGKPNNLPDDIPIVPLALVQNAVETLFDKFLLTKILFNARKSV